MPRQPRNSGKDYDHRVFDEQDETFRTHDDSGQLQTYAKNEGVGARLKEGFSESQKQADKLKAIRKAKGWKTF